MLEPWREIENVPDPMKRFVYQQQEGGKARSLPHVLKQLPMQPTVMGMDSPHQTGDHVCYDMLTRGPLYCMTSHFTRVAPPGAGARHAPPYRRADFVLRHWQRLGVERRRDLQF